MKKLLIAASLLISLSLHAQPYNDSVERDIQNMVQMQSSHGLGALYVGYDVNLLNNMTVWLQKHGYNTINTNDADDIWSMVLKPVNNQRSKDAYISITAPYDNDMKIKSVQINGTPDELIELFVYYWNDTHLNVNKLKKGGYIYQTNGTDKIAFSWSKKSPVISITRSEDVPQVTYE